MRVGIWNLYFCPEVTSALGAAMASWMDERAADLWLLTEVHRDWDRGVERFVCSPPRSLAPPHKRWAAIQTSLLLGQLHTVGEPTHAGEEGLCLARVMVGKPTSSSVLVACSVLPWQGAETYSRELPRGHVLGFRHVLEHHVARIAAERLPGEPLIWGGDFNEQLTPPFSYSAGVSAGLRSAFDGLGLIALTERAENLNGISFAIDHLAVSAELVDEPTATVHRPTSGGKRLSDHDAYTAEIRLPALDASSVGGMA